MDIPHKKKKILVVGSIAYDHLMNCQGFFKDLLIEGDANMAITAENRTVSFGGCGGNIAYSLRLFKQNAVLMSSVGKDFEEYKKNLVRLGVNVSGIYESLKYLTASAFIVTDPSQNQVILFDAGAMNEFPKTQNLKNLGELVNEIGVAIIAPDNPQRMIQIAEECYKNDIPYLFDPAQQITHIEPASLKKAVKHAFIVVVNQHENELLRAQMGMNREDFLKMVPIFIQTKGAEGCTISVQKNLLAERFPSFHHLTDAEKSFTVTAVKPKKNIDPTGCGDAFRAGLVAGLIHGFSLQKACQTAALSATYNLEQKGTQQHAFSLEEFGVRFTKNFGVVF